MDDATDRFVEALGRHFEEDGAPRISGRLLAVLMLNEAPTSLDELTEQLRVSKGSVSSNARMLEQWGVAERVSVPGDRRDYYQVAENFDLNILERQTARVRRLREVMQAAQDSAGPGDGPVQQRLATMLDLTTHALENIAGSLERRRSLRSR